MNALSFLPLIAIAALIAVVPGWPYSRNWSNLPSNIAGAIALVFVILWLRGQL